MSEAAYKILLGITGSVATIKLHEILGELQKKAKAKEIEINVKVVATNAAMHFVPDAWGINIIKDDDDWRDWKSKGDKVQHIELRRWADILLIAPLSANTLAKIACGICDNLLTCICRAWDAEKRPMVVFPAMNTLMYTHPLTKRHLSEVESFGVKTILPVEKKLACGDYGIGALPPPDVIASIAIDTVIQFGRNHDNNAAVTE